MDLGQDGGFPGPLELHVEELIVEGIGSHDQEELLEGVKTGLVRMLAERGLPFPILQGEVDVSPEPQQVTLSRDGTSSEWGEAIGGAVFGGLGT